MMEFSKIRGKGGCVLIGGILSDFVQLSDRGILEG